MIAISPESEAAGPTAWALDRARNVPMRIELIRVVRSEEERPAALSALERARRPFLREPLHPLVTTTVVVGRVLPVLAENARRADLLVLGMRQDGSRSRLTHRVVRALLADPPTTVVVVDDAWGPTGRGAVIVGAADDGSSDDALAVAAREAARTDADLQIVHAWSNDPVAGPEQAARAAHRRVLDRAVERAHDATPRARVVPVLERGTPDEVLSGLAAHAREVVLGSPPDARRAGAATVRRVLSGVRAPLWVVPAASA